MISIIHPSRGRPQKARQTADKWLSESTTNPEYIISLDRDDPMLPKYKAQFPNEKVLINKNRTMIDAVNVGAKEAKGDILLVLSDDFECFPGWDITLLMAVAGKSDYVLKTFDGQQTWIVTLPIMDRTYYERFGFIYNPIYRHLFCDTEMTHIADAMGKLIIRNDITFRHDNPCYQQKGSDHINKKAMSSWQQGEVTYIQRMRRGFGMGLDITKINEAGAHHRAWIKKKLRV